MSKLVFHLFHDDAGSLSTVPALVVRMLQAKPLSGVELEVYIFGPAEGALADTKRTEFNAQIDNVVKLGARVTACIGLAQKFGTEEAFHKRGIALESAAIAFPRFTIEGSTVITF
jgi:hypothetical protein